MKRRPFLLHQPELFEGDHDSRPLRVPLLRSTHADPIDLSIDSMALGLGPNTAHTNDSVELVEPDSAHTVVDPETTHRVRVASVCPFVGQNAHDLL